MAAGVPEGLAAAVAASSAEARRVLVGGLLVELPSGTFEALASRIDRLVISGLIGVFRARKRIYLMPYDGITFYSKTDVEKPLSVHAVEVPTIDKGSLRL